MTGPAVQESLADRAARLAAGQSLADRASRLAGPKVFYKSPASSRMPAIQQAGDAALGEAIHNQQPSYGELLASHLLNTAQGIPGVKAVEAGAGALGSRFTDHPLSHDESAALLDENTGKIGGKTAAAEKMIGGLATAGALPGGVIGGGATYGGLSEALSDDRTESLGDRAVHTAIGAGSGAAAGVALRGAGAVAQRLGVTDFASRSLKKVADVFGSRAAGDVSEAIGTKGALNDVLGKRQAILDQLPASDKPAAQAVLEHTKAYKAQAAKDYALARADKAPITDPRVQAIVQDPAVQRAYTWAQQVYESQGNTVPEKVISAGAPAGPPQKLLPAVSGYEPTSLVPPTTAGAAAEPRVTMDLPNPEILALTKRHLQDFVERGMKVEGVSRAEAAAILPKLDRLREALHDVSPAWKNADANFSKAKTFEDAFDAAYNAKSGAAGATADPAKLKTQAAISDWAATGNQDVGPQRVAGQQAGTSQRLAEQLRGAPIGSSIDETLKGAGKLYEPSESAARYREPAFATDADRQAFAKMIAHGGENDDFDLTVKTPVGHVGLGLPDWITRSPLETSTGTAARSEAAARLASPTEAPKVTAEIAASKRGAPIVKGAGKGAVIAGQRAIRRYVPGLPDDR